MAVFLNSKLIFCHAIGFDLIDYNNLFNSLF